MSDLVRMGDSVQVRAYGLSLGGRSTREIADELHITMSEANKLVNAERQVLASYGTATEREALHRQESNRLDALMSRYWDSAMAGDIDDAKLVLKIIQTKMKLHGLDRPMDGVDNNALLIIGTSKEDFTRMLEEAQAAQTDILEGEVIEEDE